MGALHPAIFFTLVYGISLVLSIFVCRTVYYSINDEGSKTHMSAKADFSTASSVAVLK